MNAMERGRRGVYTLGLALRSALRARSPIGTRRTRLLAGRSSAGRARLRARVAPPGRRPRVVSRVGPWRRAGRRGCGRWASKRSTTAPSRRRSPQQGQTQPSTVKTEFKSYDLQTSPSAGVESPPRRPSRMTSRSEARASHSDSVELATFGMTSFLRAAFPARMPRPST
jgi:hypothetical protein